MAEGTRVGYRVVATVKDVKGTCNAGHKAGQTIELACHNSGGMCGFFYHDVFPSLMMLQFGGSFPAEWGDQDVLHLECPDRMNLVKIELRRIRE
jgi:uncharacterized repeat protein (TIGR04076 family)